MTDGAAEGSAPAPRRRARRWLAGLLGLLVVLVVLKQCVVDVRPVVGQSMWPGLVGDRDWILLERLADEPRRFEVWAVAPPEDGVAEADHILNQENVKRVLGLGGEMVDLVGGDLLVGPDADHLARVRRPPALVTAMMVPVVRSRDADVIARFRVEQGGLQPGPHGLHLKAVNEAPGTPGFLAHLRGGGGGAREGVWDDHLGRLGKEEEGRHMVPDVRIDLAVAARVAGARLTVRHAVGRAGSAGADVRALILAPSGVTVTVRGPDGAERTLAEEAGVAVPCRLRMETVDGRFRVALLDARGREERVVFAGPRETRDLLAFDPARAEFVADSHVSLEVDRGAVHLASLDILRDVYYFWPPGLREARDVREGHVFIAGDNMPASSFRQFLDVPRDRLMGRVRRVVWPDGHRLPDVDSEVGQTFDAGATQR